MRKVLQQPAAWAHPPSPVLRSDAGKPHHLDNDVAGQPAGYVHRNIGDSMTAASRACLTSTLFSLHFENMQEDGWLGFDIGPYFLD
jgi:hypothetical protein